MNMKGMKSIWNTVEKKDGLELDIHPFPLLQLFTII